MLDGAGEVVSAKTKAYLEVKQEAFRDVERILDGLLGRDAPAPAAKRVRPAGGAACSSCSKVRFGSDCDADAPEDAAGEVAPVGSVGVGALDDEHAECERRLGELGAAAAAGAGVADALRALLAAYERHFSHEERLLDEHLYAEVAADAGGFSADRNARTSHFADHEAMLGAVRALLSGGAGAVDAAAVLRLRREFARHATLYDGAYADRLSAALAARA